MELIIKPTGKCNFCCSFCSAANMDILHNNECHDKIKDLIMKLKPSNFIITGGDPLCVEPEYYYNLHDFYPVPISITSNLKSFYMDPDKWTPLFREDWFYVATSFQYGDGRKWDKDHIYDEDMFKKVISLFIERTGRKAPPFISVIDKNNEDRYLDHVLLAKELGTIVRLNNMMKIGKQDIAYPRYKLYKMYIDIIDKGLEMYETNCIERKMNKCPRNLSHSCVTHIRACYVDNSGELHVGICDDNLALGNEFKTEEEINGDSSLLHKYDHNYINDQCQYCELCRLCNGCFIGREEAREFPEHCEEMKKLEEDIIRTGWML